MSTDRLRSVAAGRGVAGFTYLGLLIVVAILALATSGTLTLGSIVERRAAEERLLEVGSAYRQAIASYLNSSPAGDRRFPGALADLLKDPRYPGVRRHLRKLYPDPISGKNEWGLIGAPGGGIMGVHSLSAAQPIKIADFDRENEFFEGASRYSEWVFLYRLPAVAARPVPAAGAGSLRPGSAPAPAQIFAPQNPAAVGAAQPSPTLPRP
jgi:type II secretory pathway pseudopilin PulG